MEIKEHRIIDVLNGDVQITIDNRETYGTRVWVKVNGVCLFRSGLNKSLVIVDDRGPSTIVLLEEEEVD